MSWFSLNRTPRKSASLPSGLRLGPTAQATRPFGQRSTFRQSLREGGADMENRQDLVLIPPG